MTHDRLRLGVIGAGWITSIHLAALDRLDRTTLVGVASARLESAEATAEAARARGLRRHRADARRAAAGRRLRGGPAVRGGRGVRGRRSRAGSRSSPRSRWPPRTPRVRRGSSAAIAERGLVVAVGYHLRSLEQLPEVRARLADNPARLVTARWNDATPPPAWWRREVDGGGQVIEQATHLYDLARLPRRRGRGRRRRVAPRDPGDAARRGRRGRQRGRPALRHGRRGDVREHAPPVDARSSRSRSAPTGW